jgi:hypothetical protein
MTTKTPRTYKLGAQTLTSIATIQTMIPCSATAIIETAVYLYLADLTAWRERTHIRPPREPGRPDDPPAMD